MALNTRVLSVLGGALLLSAAAQAQTTYYIVEHIPYQNPAKVAERISNECTELGSLFANTIAAEAKKRNLALISSADAANQPNRVEVVITDVRSYGNAFTGHYKSVDIQVNRYTNGQPDGETHISRRSTGGIGGAFKSSCSVLDRTTNTLSSDIVKWLQSQAASATAAEMTPMPATH